MNRNMALKNTKAQAQRTEYAIQAGFADLSAPVTNVRAMKGKVIFVKGRAVLVDAKLIPLGNVQATKAPAPAPAPAKPAVVKPQFRKGYAWTK